MASTTGRKLTSGTPKTRLGLSLAERIKVIEARKMGKSMRQLATQFGCGKTQILNTLAQKDRYICEWEVMGRNNPFFGARKRFRHTRNEQINRSVHEWYRQQTDNGIRVTGPMLQKQARQYAVHFGIVNFAASNGWLANFRKFYNVINKSSHFKLQKLSVLDVLPSNNQTVEKHQANLLSSKYPVLSTYVPVDYEKEEGRPWLLDSDQKDPLSEDTLRFHSLDLTRLKLEPVDRSYQIDYFPKVLSTKLPVMCSIPTPNLIMQEDYSKESDDLVSNHRGNDDRKHYSGSSSMNHRKRRLLQLELSEHPTPEIPSSKTSRPESSKYIDERKIPKLVPIISNAVFQAEFLNLARAKGLTVLIVKDDNGHEWVEIRQSVASYRVPRHGYPTHLSRLIVDSSLHYFLEVLGHCVQNGSLLYNNDANLNYDEASLVLNAVSGEFIVCTGIEPLPDKAIDLNIRTVQEVGSANDMYATLPDFRFRSVECLKWIDYRYGPKCSACKHAIHLQTLGDLPSVPIDLRCMPSHLKY